MTTPANDIKDEVRVLVDGQIELFRQPRPLTSPQLSEFHYRSVRIRVLCQELDQMGTWSVKERRSQSAA